MRLFSAFALLGGLLVSHAAVAISAGQVVTLDASPSPSLFVDFRNGTMPAAVTYARASGATCVNSAGLIVTLATSAPCFDFDPIAHVTRGLRIEGQQETNYLFPSANWKSTVAPSGSVDGVTQSAGTAPDGSSAAMAIVPGTFSSSSHVVSATFTGAVSTTWIYSVFIKANGYTGAYIDLSNTAFASTLRVCVDLTSGAIAAQTSGASAAVQQFANGWYRVSVQNTSTASGGTYASSIRVFDTAADCASATAFTGNGTSGILVWGNQAERAANGLQPNPSSYIPTTSGQATRAAESASIAVGSWYNPQAGTIIGNLMIENPNGQFSLPFALVDGNPNVDYLGLAFLNAATNYVLVTSGFGGSSATSVSPGVSGGAFMTAARVYSSVVSQSALAGRVSAMAANSQGIFAAPTALGFMGAVHYQAAPSGWVAWFAYYQGALPSNALARAAQ